MRMKFNFYERMAGIFVLSAVIGTAVIGLSTAIHQGWFEKKIHYSTVFENADGIREGTAVQISGLRVGAVSDVQLEENNRIRVRFFVSKKFQSRIRENSEARLFRPYIIGERALDLSAGDDARPVLAPESQITSQETMDLMTLISGKNVNRYLETVGGTFESLHFVLEAFKDRQRAEGLIRVFDGLDPLIVNLQVMSKEVTKLSRQATHEQGMEKLVKNLNMTTHEMNRILPELNEYNPELAKDLAVVTKNLSIVMNAFGPAVASIEGDIPQTGQRLVEVLNETGILLKAMQKSVFIRGSVKEVREEESQRRMPAQEK